MSITYDPGLNLAKRLFHKPDRQVLEQLQDRSTSRTGGVRLVPFAGEEAETRAYWVKQIISARKRDYRQYSTFRYGRTRPLKMTFDTCRGISDQA